MFSIRLKAGVLQLSLGIALVIAVICSSMILLAYYARLVQKRHTLQSLLRDNASSGIQYAMDIRELLPYYEVQTVDLFGEGVDSVSVVRRPWGLFEILGSSALRGEFSVSRYALVGVPPDTLTRAAIYLPGNQGQLNLAGKTIIVGDVYVPEARVMMGFLAGKEYVGDKLVDGRRLKSASIMPSFDSLSLHYLLAMVESSRGNYKTVVLENLTQEVFGFDTDIVNVFKTDESLDIKDSLSGNLIIYSGQKVTIRQSAFLRDVIILGDEIEIQDGFNGSAQFFAFRRIDIGKECKLYYPSGVSLINARTDSLISIGDSSVVEGIVAIPGFDPAMPSKGRLHLKKDTAIKGYVYCNATAEIEGVIMGHISVSRFEAKSSINYLLDAVIRADLKPDDLPAPHSWGMSKKSALVKWLR